MRENKKCEYKQNITKTILNVFVFCAVGIALNIAGANVASAFGLPLYFDSVGTVLVAALGGYLPGVITGFLSNIINAFTDTVNAYYSLISVLISLATAYFADKGYFKTLWQSIIVALPLALIGGVAGSALTYCLNGFSFGNYQPVLDQFISYFVYDFADKAITVIIVYVLLRLISHYTRRTSIRFHGWKQRPLNDEEREKTIYESEHSNRSLRAKLTTIVSIILIAIFGVTGGIAFKLYEDATVNERIQLGTGVAKLAASLIPSDRVHEFIENGESSPGYSEIERQLEDIKKTSDDIMYVYSYKVMEDGCHVVFDLDTPGTPGSDPGDVIAFDDSFQPYIDDLLAGRPIEPVESNDTYGWLMTMYEPIYDSAGNCVAYACVDISMGEVRLHGVTFLTKLNSLFVAFLIVIQIFGLWLADYNLILPINSMAVAADRFAKNIDENIETNAENFKNLDIQTGDEIQNLYESFSMTVGETVRYIADTQEKSNALNKMQNGLILVLADLVESRDKSTGDHVRKTAAYCRLILDELRKEGKFSDIITDDYIDDVFNSAPLHDIGKIVVPDAILNKPGKLTDEEFTIMKTHAAAGEKIIQEAIQLVATDTGYLQEAKKLAAYHHEKWDGTGYPYGIKGAQIPLSARVMAVADVYDALVSRRSYKPPFDYDKAFSIIEEGAGTHFDPDCAAAFLKVRKEAEEIAEGFDHYGVCNPKKVMYRFADNG